jgi:hypothetical protein
MARRMADGNVGPSEWCRASIQSYFSAADCSICEGSVHGKSSNVGEIITQIWSRTR